MPERNSRKSRTDNAAGLAAVAAIALALIFAVGPAAAEDGIDAELPVRGIVRPINQAMISSELSAPAVVVGFKEGESFKAGDTLVEFDCRRHQAELAAVEAQRQEMQLVLDNTLVLEKHKAVGKQDVEIARVRVDKAAADSESLRVRLDTCRIRAPFDGHVAEISIHAFETPAPGKPFISIIEDSKLEIELIVPSEWLRWLKPAAVFTFTVDETGRSFAATVIRTAAAVDPVSQTIKVFGAFTEPSDGVLSGMSGTADFRRSGS